MPVFVNNLQDKVSIEDGLEELLIAVVDEALRDSGIAGDPEVSLVFVDDEYIADLNRQYRSVEGPTPLSGYCREYSTTGLSTPTRNRCSTKNQPRKPNAAKVCRVSDKRTKTRAAIRGRVFV